MKSLNVSGSLLFIYFVGSFSLTEIFVKTWTLLILSQLNRKFCKDLNTNVRVGLASIKTIGATWHMLSLNIAHWSTYSLMLRTKTLVQTSSNLYAQINSDMYIQTLSYLQTFGSVFFTVMCKSCILFTILTPLWFQTYVFFTQTWN